MENNSGIKKNRITFIAATLVFILCVTAAYFFLFNRQQKANLDQQVTTKQTSIRALMQLYTAQLELQYKGRIQSLAFSRKELISAFARQDRERLYLQALPIYELLKRENPYFNSMGFVLADNTAFLRLHRPDTFGDDLSAISPMIATSNLNHMQANGFELGCCGLEYRIVHPLIHDGKFVGVVFFGIKVEQFIEILNKEMQLHAAYDVLRRQAPNNQLNQLNGRQFESRILVAGEDALFQSIEQLPSNRDDSVKITFDTYPYLVFTAQSLDDNGGQPIGSILVAADLAAFYTGANAYLRNIAILSVGVLLLSCIVFSFFYKTLFRRIETPHDSLSRQSSELEQAKRERERWIDEQDQAICKKNNKCSDHMEKQCGLEKAQQMALFEWQHTFDAIREPVLILDLNFAIVRENLAAKRAFSTKEETLVGKTCHEVFRNRELPCSECPLHGTQADGKSHATSFKCHETGKMYHAVCSPIVFDKELIGYIHTSQDITDHETLEKQLVHAQKMEAIATLAGGIAHDFNNILGAILGNVELLLYRLVREHKENVPVKATAITTNELQDHLEAVKTAGHRAKELVAQILAFSRQSESQRQKVTLSPVMKEAVKLLRSSLPSSITFTATISPDSWKVKADPTQVHQMLMDLVTNASQSVDQNHGSIEVTLDNFIMDDQKKERYPDLNPGKYVTLSVKDDGHGMTEEVKRRIFDPFFSTRPLGESTGMGLAVLHGNVKNNDGYIDVWSEPGKGAVFTLFFPCVADDEKKEENILSMPGGHETILFVDDEEQIVIMRSRMLEFLGYTVVTATNGKEAIALFENDPEAIDILITDQTMPEMTGLELAAAVHARRENLPIILSSGYSEAVTKEEAKRVGIRKFLAKPMDMRLLADAIRELLET